MSLDTPTAFRSGLPTRPTGASRKGAPLALFLVSMSVIIAVWYWLASPVLLDHALINPAKKLDCVSYAPFRSGRRRGIPISSSVRRRLRKISIELAGVSKCIRTYSVENGLDKVPELASKVGLKVILGIWLGRDRGKNAALIDTALSAGQEISRSRDVRLFVGSEVLLRGEMTRRRPSRDPSARSRRASRIPVTLRRFLGFLAALPGTGRRRRLRDDPHAALLGRPSGSRRRRRRPCRSTSRRQVALGLPRQGNPDRRGRLAEQGTDARRSRCPRASIRRASFPGFSIARGGKTIASICSRPMTSRGNVSGKAPSARIGACSTAIPAHLNIAPGSADQQLSVLEAATGRRARFRCIPCSLVALAGRLRRRPSSPGLAAWLAVSISATTGGILLGLSAEQAFYENYGVGGWFNAEPVAGRGNHAALLLSPTPLMAGRALPTFLELLAPARALNPVPAWRWFWAWR